MQNVYIKRILSARVYDIVKKTPLSFARNLSQRLKNKVFIKREDLQPVHSFKLRGAHNKLSRLTPEQAKLGVIAASAGNHAQGVALSAQKLGIAATIVMPETTPEIKIMAVKNYGAKVILHGDTFNQALELAKELEEKNNYTFIHPYDDASIIAGQGTIGLEILQQKSDPIEAIFIPVGGGGLIAGMATYIKYLQPEIKIIGVEADDSACLQAAMKAGRRVTLDEVGIFADGVAVSQIGEKTFELCQQFVDEVITVNTDEVCCAISDIFTDTRAISEPAGALATAGLKKYLKNKNLSGKNFITILSGANINFDRLRYVSERSDANDGGEINFAVTLPEKPGSFCKLCHDLGEVSITEFNYRYSNSETAAVFVGIRLKQQSDKTEFFRNLTEKGYETTDLSENELAKTHIRYTVGGHILDIHNEIFLRFQFPERPGALIQFLNKMQNRWNCSMFHYRNHGAAFGRVFMGLQVDKEEYEELKAMLDDIGYEYKDESDNLACKLFLH